MSKAGHDLPFVILRSCLCIKISTSGGAIGIYYFLAVARVA
jgi:hypothetical protein